MFLISQSERTSKRLIKWPDIMRYITTFLLIPVIFLSIQTLNAQPRETTGEFSIETEPMAYILGGAGATASYQAGGWSYSIEAFGGLTIPESLHGNKGFGTSLRGVELQVERFLTGQEGFYIGPEIGVSNLEVTHKPSSSSENKRGYSVGVRVGYQWETGLGDLYLTPVGGMSYSLSSRDIQIEGETFESNPVTPWATIGIGWSF